MSICVRVFLMVLISLHVTHATTSSVCSAAYSCEFSEKISPSECSGYYGCAYSKLVETSSVKCSGSFSCYGVSMINMTTPNTNSSNNFYLTCSGLYSCANVSSIGHYSPQFTSLGVVKCDGELSCFASSLTLTSSSLSCSGDRSCLNCNATLNSVTVEAVGYLSTANSVFKISQGETSVKFIGMESGKNTTVICSGTNTNCTISCYNNACNELRLIYDKNDCNNCQFHIDCRYAFNSDVCPDGLDFETELTDFLWFIYGDVDDWYHQSVFNNFSMPAIPSLYENVTTEYTSLDNSFDACAIGNNMSSIIVYKEILNNSVYYNYTIDTGVNNEYPINCMDISECEQDILNTNDFVDKNISSITVPICCTAGYSCYASTNLKNTITQTGAGIRCDGYESCDGGSDNTTYITSSGNIYVSGSSNLNDFMLIDGKNSDNNELFCNGGDTCQVSLYITREERRIRNFQNVFCNGDSSCENIDSATLNLTFENIGNSVFFYGGSSGGYGMKFNNIGNSVYCVGGTTRGCSESVIKNVMGSVYGIGYQGIVYSVINNATNVYGIGDYSMRYNTILNVKNNIYFIGGQAARDTTIQNAQNVKYIILYMWVRKDQCFVFCFYFLICCCQLVAIAIGSDSGEALYGSKISQVKTILISGTYCLSGANISSNFGDSTKWSQSDRILTLKINCDFGFDFDIYCTKNDICNIDCMTSSACDSMRLYCDGTCHVSKCMYMLIICWYIYV